MKKTAFLTGVTGQDGSYLAELLLDKGYEVHAIMRRVSVFTTARIDHIFSHPNLHIHYGDLVDSSNLNRLIKQIRPSEIYNLGAQSHVAVSFEVPEYTAEVNGLGTLRLLDALRDLGNDCRYYQASTSEMFGGLPETAPQNENTPFYPKSPYGASKLYGYWMTKNYRESYGLFTVNGVLFNHESPRRGETFVTRKITKAVARIEAGLQDELLLGNLNAVRDWGHAKDYVYAQWLMLQASIPDDYVVATGEGRNVRDFVNEAFGILGRTIVWEGDGVNELGIRDDGKIVVRVDRKYFRPSEVDILIGDPSKIKRNLEWECQYTFRQLVAEMVFAEMVE